LVAALVPLEDSLSGEVVDRIGAHVQENGEVACLENVGKMVHSPSPFRTLFRGIFIKRNNTMNAVCKAVSLWE
jgi:hypothetical protein